jgi:hypothetical protein
MDHPHDFIGIRSIRRAASPQINSVLLEPAVITLQKERPDLDGDVDDPDRLTINTGGFVLKFNRSVYLAVDELLDVCLFQM